jgi:hypothetical protein
MKSIILAALTVLSLAACSAPTINGPSDTAQSVPAQPYEVMGQTGPYMTTAPIARTDAS